MTEDIQDDVRDTPRDPARDTTRDATPAASAETAPEAGSEETALLELLRRLRMHAALEGNDVTLPRDVLADMLSLALGGLVDEAWYRARYPDVGEAVERGVLPSGCAHYVQAGIYEGRMPYRVPLDNADYLACHPDVLASVREGAFRSALDHFVRVGFAEGRTFRLASREAPDP